MRTAPTIEELRRAPKVLLHDHLDGGLRPSTVIELAREAGYAGLPTTDEPELTQWFTDNAIVDKLPAAVAASISVDGEIVKVPQALHIDGMGQDTQVPAESGVHPEARKQLPLHVHVSTECHPDKAGHIRRWGHCRLDPDGFRIELQPRGGRAAAPVQHIGVCR